MNKSNGILKLKANQFLKIVPDSIYLRIVYLIKTKKILSLNKPKSFNEKIQWLKLHDRNPLYTNLVDKFEVRKYLSQKIGEEYLIPILGIYDSFDEIDFENLPSQFVLKCTHDSGGLVICNNKDKLDIESAREKINTCLKENYYWTWREWPYKNVKPKIICEQYMVDESGTDLKDYKFMCFNGEPKCSFVCLNRNAESGLNVDFYDIEWQPLPFERHYPRSSEIIEKPKQYNKMIEISRALSKDIPFLRVDFYEIQGQLFIGELTFYPGSGYEQFNPESYDYLLGSWLKLPMKKNM